MSDLVRPGEGSPSDANSARHVPGCTFRVVADGHWYPLDHDGSGDVWDAMNVAIAREVAAGIAAPVTHVEVTDIDYDGSDYVTVLLAVRAPLNHEPMTAFWKDGAA